MEVHEEVLFPRKIIAARRVGIPQVLGRDILKWTVPMEAAWSVTRNAQAGLVLRPSGSVPRMSSQVSITTAWQVPIPNDLLASLNRPRFDAAPV